MYIRTFHYVAIIVYVLFMIIMYVAIATNSTKVYNYELAFINGVKLKLISI